MSDWEGLPTLAPPQSLDKSIQLNSDSDLKFYSTELGLTNNLRPITPDIDSSKKLTDEFPSRNKSAQLTDEFPSRNKSAQFTDPPVIVRSKAWSSVNSVKPTKKRQWTQSKSNFSSCIKSVKCRFTALGVFLGLILSLVALIPIVAVWQTSASKSNSIPSSSNSGVGTSLNISTSIGICDSYFCQEEFNFTTNMTITKLSLVITVQQTGNTTYYDTFNTNNGVINSTYTTSATEIVYTFFIQGNQVLLANTYTCAVQFNLPGLNHTTSNDQYSIQITNICGITNSASGYFE